MATGAAVARPRLRGQTVSGGSGIAAVARREDRDGPAVSLAISARSTSQGRGRVAKAAQTGGGAPAVRGPAGAAEFCGELL